VFISQLDEILINGNFGDFIMNTESEDIISYFLEHNPKVKIMGNTNGSARNADFWRNLGSMGISMFFCLDGLEDVHHLHRQDTVWQRVIDNALIFKAAGGYAIWKMIIFDHNKHQIEACKQMSKDLGFDEFCLVDDGRDTGPVFDRSGNLSHNIGKNNGPKNVDVVINFKNYHKITLPQPANKLRCATKESKSIFISADGKVYPCCYLAQHVLNWGEGQLNTVTRQIVADNDLRNNDLETCIRWFGGVESRWSESDPAARVSQCDSSCSAA
jgi:MoaA/NifB/PqqE/SkfB family radical SAM enzyme